jgi:SAM-dependent methyltransferase
MTAAAGTTAASPSEAVFTEEYFRNRRLNDPKRVKCFASERAFIKSVIRSGDLLDVGCSTGEMIKALEWDGDCYGMEISEHARKIAMEAGIRFDKPITEAQDAFDIIVFRGTIQHVDTPFLYLKCARKALRKGGKVVFLATPNANSIYFKLWSTLPFLDIPTTNYFIPHDKWLIQAMENFGFRLVKKRYPYLSSPYASPLRDHFRFLLKLFGAKVKFPFWRNSMDLIFEKA